MTTKTLMNQSSRIPAARAPNLTIKSLDGLRGLAVLLVLLSHLSLHGMNLMGFLDFSGFGKAGVYLFFVLSAFLLTYQALGGGGDVVKSIRYWAGYFTRRVFRIYPLYLIVLLVGLLVTTQTSGFGPKIPSLDDVVRHLLLQDGVSIYWAIPVEFTFYLILPFVCLTLWMTSKTNMLLCSSVVLATMIGVYVAWPPSEALANTIMLGPYFQIFLLGSFAAVLVGKQSIADEFVKRPRIMGIVGWLALFLVALTIPEVWQRLVDPEAGNKIFHSYFLAYGLVWTAAVVAALYGGLGFTRFFEFTVWRFLGRISFSIYLWHLPIVQWVDREVNYNAMMQFLIALLASVVVGYVSYRLIERPFIAWGHRLSSNK